MFGVGVLDLLFPPSCTGCGRVLPSPGLFCEPCEALLELTPAERCGQCAEPGVFASDACPRCRVFSRRFERAFAPFSHSGPIARAIHRFKYEDHPELAPNLALLLKDEADEFLAEAPQLIAAIPLHAGRFRKRRYDQAQLLAGALAQATGRTFKPSLLERVKATARQVGLSDSEREANLAGAFVARGPLEDARVLLVDDVFTTGATASAAAGALLDAGARSVWVLTLARANLLSS